MAEIEHFIDPNDKSHFKFKMVENDILPLWTAENQEKMIGPITDLTIGKALETGVICNETMGYFMARSYSFLTNCGIKPEAIRYRQHRSKEMAHYAQDCWDAEVETSYGWIEVAGHADRSCFDLVKHSEKCKVDMFASRQLKEAIKITEILVSSNKKVLKKDSKAVDLVVSAWTEEEKTMYYKQLSEDSEIAIILGDGSEFKLTPENIKIEQKVRTVQEEKYIPHVIEPSFGIGRIIYCIFEHCFKVRP